MAHFTRIRSTWITLTTIDGPTELEALDAGQFASLNGDAGGTWNPAAVVTIQGAGLNVVGPCALSNVAASSFWSGTGGALTVTNGNGITVNSGAHFALSSGALGSLNGNATLTLSGSAEIDLNNTSTLSTGPHTSQSCAGTWETANATVTFDGHCRLVSTTQTFPTGFVGGETVTLGYDGVADFTTTFAATDQNQSNILTAINAAAGFSFAAAGVDPNTMTLTGLATGLDSSGAALGQVRVVSSSAASVLTVLGLSVTTRRGDIGISYQGNTASGTMTRTGQTNLSSQAAIGWRDTTVADASGNVDGGLYDIVFVPITLGAARTYTFNAPTNNIKARCIVSRMANGATGAFTAAIVDGPSLTTLKTLNASANTWVEIFFDGTNWNVVNQG